MRPGGAGHDSPAAQGGSLVIRATTPADAALILGFLHKKAAFDASMTTSAVRVVNDETQIRATLFGERALARAIVADRDGEPCGFAVYYFRYSSFSGRPSLWLEDLYVDESVRSCGVGASLMEELVAIARASHCTHLAWTAAARNRRGLAFYQRLGAQITDEGPERMTLRLVLT